MPLEKIFIIGNAFGWSTIVLALAFPSAKVVALDAGIEGEDNMVGIDLTNQIAKNEGLNVIVEYGYSPYDIPRVAEKYFGNNFSFDLIFIDGLHTNEQLLNDFFSVNEFCNSRTIFIYHDIINWKMEYAFNQIKKVLSETHDSFILWRTTSGMGVSCPKILNSEAKRIFYYFTEKDEYIKRLQYLMTIEVRLRAVVAKILPRFIKNIIKRLVK